jgi:hypothetical protein
MNPAAAPGPGGRLRNLSFQRQSRLAGRIEHELLALASVADDDKTVFIFGSHQLRLLEEAPHLPPLEAVQTKNLGLFRRQASQGCSQPLGKLCILGRLRRR